MLEQDLELVDDEALQEGDLVNVLGIKQITRIKAYTGPHAGLGCFAIAYTKPGVGFSLWRGQQTQRVRRP